MKLMRELRRRRVFGTVALYIVAAWVAIQAAATAFPGLDIADRAIRHVWLAAILGFPVALVFAWRFQITAQGIVRTPPASAGEDAANLDLNKTDYALLTGLAIAVVSIGFWTLQYIQETEQPFGLSAFGREIHPDSVAVLPLDNLTGDTDQDYFVEGIHESMTAMLSQIGALRVKSRTSTSRYKGSSMQLTEIAHELGVANVIEGSVFRTGDQVRITVQLIDAATDDHIWARSYDREVRDILALQSEVAREVARQVGVQLTPDENNRLRIARQIDPKVYEAYVKGMHFIKQLDPVAINTGFDYMHEALGIDPREPLAYAGIALGYNTIGHGINAHGAFPKAIAAATKALELDELSGEAWAALAEAQLYYDWDWEMAEANMLRALQLSPSLDHVHAHYAYLLLLLGEHEKAVEFTEKARDLSPVDPMWAGFAAWLYMVEGRFEEAIQTAEECLLFSQEFDLCRYALGQIYSAQGDFDAAVETHEQIAVGDPFRNWALGISYALAGRKDDALQAIEAMSVNATTRDQLHITLAYSAMGDIEQAMTWLGVAYESRADWLPWIVLPHAYGGSVEPLRDEAGYQVIVDAMNIPVAQQ